MSAPLASASAPSDLDAAFARHVAQREYPKTLCPSEVARAFAPSDWRPLMPRLRQMAFEARDRDEVEILQGGQVIDADRTIDDVKGPIRIRKRQAQTGQ